MWPELPIEFLVVGTPVSLQSSNTRARDGWKALVLSAAEQEVGGDSWAFDTHRLSVTMFYFPQAEMQGDVDNIAKLTIDALVPRVYLDDSLVDRVLVQRFYPEFPATFDSPSETLLKALASKEPVLFIKIDEVQLEEVTT
ncbi:RusA family crossover junction endodeoxyribonuclease [Rhodobacter capsulatus]|uniref:RusA family crossover junction endodeoxyribonuclease n=1 Tax=Rhodobacter capsulatus TaxID=1061 RepID=UPI004028EDEB